MGLPHVFFKLHHICFKVDTISFCIKKNNFLYSFKCIFNLEHMGFMKFIFSVYHLIVFILWHKVLNTILSSYVETDFIWPLQVFMSLISYWIHSIYYKFGVRYCKWTLLCFYFIYSILICRASLIAQLVKNLSAKQETPVRFLGQEELLAKG